MMRNLYSDAVKEADITQIRVELVLNFLNVPGLNDNEGESMSTFLFEHSIIHFGGSILLSSSKTLQSIHFINSLKGDQLNLNVSS